MVQEEPGTREAGWNPQSLDRPCEGQRLGRANGPKTEGNREAGVAQLPRKNGHGDNGVFEARAVGQ